MKSAAIIIHLARATERKPQVDWLMQNLPCKAQVLKATDGTEMSEAQKNRVYHRNLHRPAYPFRLSASEIGCFLSHRAAWKAILEQGLDWGLIVEDDVTFDTARLQTSLDLTQKFIQQAGLIRLPVKENERVAEQLQTTGELKLFRAKLPNLGMQAQMVSAGGARHLLQVTEKFDRPVDTFLQMSWASGLRPLSIFPSSVAEISRGLGGSTIQMVRTPLNRLAREIQRPIYRARIVLHNGLGHQQKPEIVFEQ